MPEICLYCDPECQESMEKSLKNGLKAPYFYCPKLRKERDELLKKERIKMENEATILDFMKKIDCRLSNIENDIAELKEGQKQLQEDMTEVKENVKYIWDDIAKHEKRIDRLAK